MLPAVWKDEKNLPPRFNGSVQFSPFQGGLLQTALFNTAISPRLQMLFPIFSPVALTPYIWCVITNYPLLECKLREGRDLLFIHSYPKHGNCWVTCNLVSYCIMLFTDVTCFASFLPPGWLLNKSISGPSKTLVTT